MRFKYFIFLCFFGLTIGCSNVPEDVKIVLSKSGANRKELEKVINYFKHEGNIEKLNAAYFLIGNITGHNSSNCKIINNYLEILDSLNNNWNYFSSKAFLEKKISKLLDSLETNFGSTKENTKFIPDMEVISSEILIDNINLSYNVWKTNKWAKHLSFDQYCEYILPYRVLNEPLQNWRGLFMQDYSDITDSFRNCSNPIKVCLAVNNRIAKNYKFSYRLSRLPILGPLDIRKYPIGVCEQRLILVACALRSIGVAVRVDYFPQWNRRPGGHYFLSLIDSTGKSRAFNGGEIDVAFPDSNLSPFGIKTATKMYTITYGDYLNDFTNRKNKRENVPPFFQSKKLLDVSKEFDYPQTSLKIHLNTAISNNEFAYLCSFDYGLKIVPIAYCKVKNKNLIFENIGKNGIYLPMYFHDGIYAPLTQPIVVPKNSNSIKFLKPNISKVFSYRFTRKYPIQDSTVKYCENLVGGKFQISEDKNFRKPLDIYQINKIPYNFEEIVFNTTPRAKFIRYLPPKGKRINIAELEYYTINAQGEFKIIHGLPFVNSTSKLESDINNAFDTDLLTSLICKSNSWIATDLGTKTNVAKIKFIAQENSDVIEIGHVYELFYFDMGWISLGKQEAINNYIIYNNIPNNSLILLKDYTKGRAERISVFQNGTFEWW